MRRAVLSVRLPPSNNLARGIMSQQLHARQARIIAAAFSAIFMGFSAASSAADNCDRSCLAGLITTYADALVAKDPSRLPLGENVKVTENSKAIKLGEGIWKTATAKETFRHDYLDTRRQVAASHMVVLEGQTQALYSVILHVKDRKIAGIETLVQRINADSRFKPTELGKPVKGMNDPVPAGKKQSRDSMIKTALTYTEGLRVGSFIDGGTPFASETYRVENGVVTAGGNCGRADCGMYAQNIILHPGIIASVAAVDEDNGVVLLWMNFGHTGSSYGEGNSLVTFEAFKVWGGQIHAINAFFLGLPISTSRFWPTADPIPK
jgi:hypothetical protein